MRGRDENAVSPVVGVMLMLIVVIIIAAIVSAFAGGTISGQKKVPQAAIQGKFSISNGMQIIHAGGDGLATSEIVFIIRDSSMFGQNLEQKTAQVLNKTMIQNSNSTFILNSDGSSGITSFLSGDTLYISGLNSTCQNLTPVINATGSLNLCISNTTNVGKSFSLEVSDTRGNLIAKTDVPISP